MQRSLGEFLIAAAAAFGDDVAYQVRRGMRLERITFRQVEGHARRLAAWLGARGLCKGDRIAVWSPNMPEYAVLYFGAWLAGVVVVPIDVRTRQEVVDRFITAAGPRLGFTSRHIEGTFGAPVAETFALETLFELIATTPPLLTLPDVGPDDLCEIAFTSGTTGVPKGVMLTHGNFLAEIESLRVAFPLKRTDRALSVLPLSHAFEQVIGFLLPFSFGARVTYVPRATAVTLARAMREEQVTAMAVVPELLRLLLTAIERRAQQEGHWRSWQLGHWLAPRLPVLLRRLLFRRVHTALGGALQFFGCGGAALDPKVARAWERMGVAVFEGYGLTETTAAATINTRTAKRLGSAGKPLPGVEVRIAEDDEILVRGPTVTPGYYDNPELTARSFVDGWFRTGDIGRFDQDGFLHITGRQAFKIVLPDGRNVYPEDIEQILNQHPLVKESCVVGVARDGGETVHAAIITAAPEHAAEIVRETNRHLGAHQQITGFTVWSDEDFPRTPILKVDRKLVRATVERGLARAAPMPAAAAPATTDPLVAIIARTAERPPSTVHDAAELEADLGLDSIGRIELLSIIEEELGRAVEEGKVGPQTTVAELRRLVDEGTAGDIAPVGARWPRAWWAQVLRRGLLWAAFRLQDHWMRIEIVHRRRAARVPVPSILVFNYEGPYVPLLLLRALPPWLRARVAIAADARLWQGRDRWQGWLVALGAQGFPFVKRGAGVRASLAEVARWLDDGYAVILSPEGDPEREEGTLLPFLGGVGLLAVELGVPVVPFRVEGYYRLFPQKRSFPYLPNRRGRVRLIIGEPITFPKTLPYHEATERVRQALLAMR